jgi:hypothetical protein
VSIDRCVRNLGKLCAGHRFALCLGDGVLVVDGWVCWGLLLKFYKFELPDVLLGAYVWKSGLQHTIWLQPI